MSDLKEELTLNIVLDQVKEHLGLFQALITSTELSQDEILENFIKICGDWGENNK